MIFTTIGLLVNPAGQAIRGFTSGSQLGTVIPKQQPVHLIRAGKKYSISSFGKILKPGDRIKTGKGGKAKIKLPDGDVVLLAPQSEIDITAEHYNTAKKKEWRSTFAILGKIRAVINRKGAKRYRFKTVTAVVGVKGTDFIVEYADQITSAATLEGLVNLESTINKQSIDIPPGKMSRISLNGEVMPLSEIAGEILKDVEIAGEEMTEDDSAGEKIKM